MCSSDLKSAASGTTAQRVKKNPSSPFGTRHNITVKEHGINPKLVDERAWDVVAGAKRRGRIFFNALGSRARCSRFAEQFVDEFFDH